MVPLEPWEKVYIKLGTANTFEELEPVHGKIGCAGCHRGADNLSAKDDSEDELLAIMEQAHEGLVADPSANAEERCGWTWCHHDITKRNATSIHTEQWGMKHAVALRAGYSDFESCPSTLQDGFEGECSHCHTSCGQCHISRPHSVDGGLLNKHVFQRTPSMTNNCTACHGSRVGNDYLGKLEGNQPDAHFSRLGYHCVDCHQEDFHGDGETGYTSRYEVAGLPNCYESCHSDADSSNNWHLTHVNQDDPAMELSCYVCHSQTYTSCNACHTNGEWKSGGGYSEYPEFRIGHNPGLAWTDAKWILVRHIPVVADTYAPWGWSTLSQYDSEETWRYTSPHNIQRITARTSPAAGEPCYSACHVTGAQAENNANLYLWESFLINDYPAEVDANQDVIVDDHLPAGWGP